MHICSGVDQGGFRKILWPQEYLMESADRYSLSDIVLIHTNLSGGGVKPTATLIGRLSDVLQFCESHTGHCPQCAEAVDLARVPDAAVGDGMAVSTATA